MKILDCTIRDGGYYTNWDFSAELVDTYLNSVNQLPIDYIEVGYRSKPMSGYLGKYFYCPIEVLKEIKTKSEKKLVIILNEKDVSASDAHELLSPIQDYVTMVRLAIDPKNFKRALELAKEVKSLGFEVGFNVMYMSTWNEHKEFLDLIPQVDGIADYFYMVDSFGGVFPEDVRATISLVRSKTKVKLGFHGHNNLEMALANTLVAIEEGVDIVDATFTGMGRGAGNLKIELLLTVLQSKNLIDFNYNPLSEITEEFSKLQESYGWGANLPYMFSGANSLPQKQVMEWVGKRYYSFNSIIRGLSNQSLGRKDNISLPKFEVSSDKYRSVMLVGGGPSVVEHAKAIEQFLNNNPNILVVHASSKNAFNFSGISNDQLFCLIGNEGYRLERVFGQTVINGSCILPPFPREMGTYIPDSVKEQAMELISVDFTKRFKDSHTAIALQTIIDAKIEEVYVLGYDAYSGNISLKEQDLFNENKELFEKFKLFTEKELVSLTPTGYEDLTENSIYSLI